MTYISIITPLLNGEKEIVEHLINLEKQILPTGLNLEIIIIDGGSNDQSIELINGYSKNTNLEIKAFIKPGSTIYEASNYGILKSRGQYLLFLNCDDFLASEKTISLMYQKAENSSADIVYGNCSFVDYSNNELYQFKVDKKPSLVWKYRLFNISHPCALINRRCIVELNYYDTRFTHVADCDFFIKAYLNGFSFCFINEIIAKFRLGFNNASRSERAEIDWYNLKMKYLKNNTIFKLIHFVSLTLTYCRDLRYFSYRIKRFYENNFHQT